MSGEYEPLADCWANGGNVVRALLRAANGLKGASKRRDKKREAFSESFLAFLMRNSSPLVGLLPCSRQIDIKIFVHRTEVA